MEAQEKVNWLSFIVWSIVTLFASYTLASIPIWILESHKVLNFQSISTELIAFIVVMAIGEVSSSGSAGKKPEFNREGGAKVALFVLLAVLPEYMQYVLNAAKEIEINKREVTRQALGCIFKYDNYDQTQIGSTLVLALLIISLIVAVVTARGLHLFEKNGNEKEHGSLLSLAVISSVVAIIMLSVYLLMKHMNVDQLAYCSNIYHSREILLKCLLLLLLIVGAAMFVARSYSVYVFIPFFIDGPIAEMNYVKSIYNQLLLLVVFIIISATAFYYRDNLSANPILLILFGLFVCFVIIKLLSAVIHWKNYYPHIALVLIATICALVVTYLAMAYFHNRSSEDLKDIPLSPENIEYLDQFKTK